MAGPHGATPTRSDWLYAVVVVVLGASWPFADFFKRNVGQYVPVGRFAWYIAATLLIALVPLVVAARRGLAITRVAVVEATVLAAFFHFNVLFDNRSGLVWQVGETLKPAISLLVWAVLAATLGRVAWKLSDLDGVRTFVLVFVGVLWIANVAGVVFEPGGGGTSVAAGGPSDETPFERTPNVYHFLLDQYPRADEARAVLGVDVSPFTAALEERGFWIGDHSYAAYPTTTTSIPAILEADYTVTTSEQLNVSEVELTRSILGTADVIQQFRAAGYSYVYADAGHDYWGTCRGDLIDACVGTTPDGLIHTEAEQALIWRTPLSTLINGGLHYARPEDVLDDLEAQADEIEEPFFLFAHILNPHEPFEYGEGCAVRERSKEGRTEADYVEEMRCLNDEMVEVVDRIQGRDPDAVIIIQSDHGTAFRADMGSQLSGWSEAQLRERFASLDLRVVPDGCPEPPAGPTLTINTYPWLLACLRGEEPEYLPPRVFLAGYAGRIEEIPDPFTAFGDDAGGSTP